MRKLMTFVALAAAVALAGCSSHKSTKPMAAKNRFGESLAGFAGKGSAYYKGKGPIPKGGGKFHVGKPYQVAGRWFTPKEQPGYDKKGAASWYGEAFHRRKTSNGEYFDMNMLTAAHPTLPLPSYARVTNLDNGKVIIVRINDRGPFVGTRIIDLSKKSADTLGFRHKGKTNVRVQWIANAPLNDQGNHLAMMNRKAMTGAGMNSLIAAAVGSVRSDDQSVQVAAVEAGDAATYQQASLNTPRNAKRKSRNEAQIVQIGSFRSLEGAENARARLSSIGPVQVFQWDTDEGPLFKVQMGPFLSDVGAEEALVAVRDEGFAKAILETARIEQVSYNH